MKGLEEWLASSSSSDSDEEREGKATQQPTTTISTNSITIGKTRNQGSTREEIRARQEEMRGRMQQLLGSKVIDGEDNPCNTHQNNNSSSKSKSKSKSICSVSSSSSKSSKHSGSSKDKKKDNDGLNISDVPEKREYRCVEVMVVDRGTQTTTTVGCQTDPVLPYQTFPGSTLPIQSTCCRCCCCSCNSGIGIGSNAGIRRPYAKTLEAKEVPTRFKEQIEMIQNSIDIMIARYNLPPPPSF
ncbi:hypothetical protein LSM04_002041 [Trypanosoma melophagium]|uniref:uncharacterized protein n=1 Tax=Trypanosoma melophagium TaxID=715481 RepID=UPI003519F39B|nr:hypothetical protein LSM04_002041 [Trypanosoma melophagium]